MPEQWIDEAAHHTCESCGDCCNQPWRVLVDEDRGRALEQHDWSAYPQLADKPLYVADKELENSGYFRIPKEEDGHRCVYLDHDNLCIIHKELGSDAKPLMCQRFPLLLSLAPCEDRVSLNYGCPSAQTGTGKALTAQAEEVAHLTPLSKRTIDPDQAISLDGQTDLALAEYDALMDRATRLFDPKRDDDLWSRFASLLADLDAIARIKAGVTSTDGASLASLLQQDAALPGSADAPTVTAFEHPARSPMGTRFLFAATVYPDAIPPEAVTRMNLFKRLTLVPKLMALATFNGAYPSRLADRLIDVRAVTRHEVSPELPAQATQQVARVFAARFWQRYLAGTRVNVVAGVHQHILDFDAIIFLARARAEHDGASELTVPAVQWATATVEAHLANQTRLYDQTMRKWLVGQLQSLELAWASLRLMSLTPAPADTPSTEAVAAGT